MKMPACSNHAVVYADSLQPHSGCEAPAGSREAASPREQNRTPSLRSDGRRGRRAQEEIGADTPFVGLIFTRPAGTESDGATGARATGEIGSACGVRIAGTVDAMRFSYAEALCDPTHYLPLARAVEDAGWDGFIVPDSICYPEVSDTKYPYTPDGNREFLEAKPFIA